MIVVNPSGVQFGTTLIERVLWVAVDRAAARLIREWSDEGPHVRLIDAPEQLVSLTMQQELDADLSTPFTGTGAPGVGTLATLTIVTQPNASDGAKRKLTATAVLVGVSHKVGSRGDRGATRLFKFEAVATDGATDPVVVTDG